MLFRRRPCSRTRVDCEIAQSCCAREFPAPKMTFFDGPTLLTPPHTTAGARECTIQVALQVSVSLARTTFESHQHIDNSRRLFIDNHVFPKRLLYHEVKSYSTRLLSWDEPVLLKLHLCGTNCAKFSIADTQIPFQQLEYSTSLDGFLRHFVTSKQARTFGLKSPERHVRCISSLVIDFVCGFFFLI